MLYNVEDLLLFSGEKYSVYFHVAEDGCSEVYDHYMSCDDLTRASFLYLVKRIAEFGHIYDETKFRIEDRRHKIYCFKPRQERFFCFFFIGRRIIITSGHSKKKQKLDRLELEKAIQIRRAYFPEE